MPVPLFQVDAFASSFFTGNPAAVCLLDEPAEAGWMQAVAAEMNLSETAFAVPRSDGSWDLRWFTPAIEIDLCGHATLATAHALWESGRALAGGTLRFHTRSGELTAEQREGWIEMDFPSVPPTEEWAPPDLIEALDVQPTHTATNGTDWLVQLRTEAEVRAVRPDIRRLATIQCRGVIVTAEADHDTPADIVSRFFAPSAGVDEDPVTGSAHCCLGPWWSERLGRSELRGLQVSARGGEVRVRVLGDRIALGGSAVTVARGELLV
ncbi:MAG TPA: PhzF family phenazine biosynthesis protein [Acidimicrobiales bacterium]|nr:PhzF family phenazine biosynthesis protein [Acidimicrobiales bacterium]